MNGVLDPSEFRTMSDPAVLDELKSITLGAPCTTRSVTYVTRIWRRRRTLR